MENDIYMIINDTIYIVTKNNGNNNYCCPSYFDRNKNFHNYTKISLSKS